ncbi:MAG: alpha/beta fold hydrolase [Acidimicrobiia bacterium]|nr:alpha/beta fold hydrolase [Acidimicrobiia bacterium]MDX2468023.1 alpha/beta fold hydrolase [Acidimicrobiia bacterium]
MTTGSITPATLPPSNLTGLDPSWSRLVSTVDSYQVERTWHVLDNAPEQPTLTLLCVHGNPTWSYLWRNVIAAAPPGVRVVAVDHLDMGFSERTGTERRLDQRISDLSAVTDALGITGPVVTIAHDWGGPISLGWGDQHRDQLAGVVLMNTAVHQPEGSPAPSLIRIARSRPVLNQLCVRTSGFIRGTLRLLNKRPSRAVRSAYHAPYRSAGRRHAIGAFVADIPLEADHPSMGALQGVMNGVDKMGDLPALLLWGSGDPVFSDLYLRDLQARLPQAAVHRYQGAGHLVSEDADIVEPIYDWISRLGSGITDSVDPAPVRPSLFAAIDRLSASDAPAVVEMEGDTPSRSISFAELAADIERVGVGLVAAGIEKGDRISLLVPPGIDLTVCLYACWRIGAVAVIADAGLGPQGMTRALKSAAPKYIIGVSRAMVAGRTLRWPGKRISVDRVGMAQRRVLGIWSSLDEIRDLGQGSALPDPPLDEDTAAVVFTSGATGPAKGVVYLHRQAQAQRDALMDLYRISTGDRLVAAFAPFALYGPAMGITSVVPDMEVTSPGTLQATALAGSIDAVDATMVFASPAALVNVLATAGELAPRMRESLLGVRVLMSAGAPVPASLLREASVLFPNAEVHTPYGMTEVLPVADVTLEQVEEAGAGTGVCVGMPVAAAEVAISPLDEHGAATGDLTSVPSIVGEICIRAAHARDGYDKLWVTSHAASEPHGWHRSGDIGHFDDHGRLWVEGRMVHIIRTATGVVTPVGVEHSAASVAGVAKAAAVGVGPVGTQQVVVVVQLDDPLRASGLASNELADSVRAAVDVDVAAVLTTPTLPIDKRHNSKINRTKISDWVEEILAGGKVGRL